MYAFYDLSNLIYLIDLNKTKLLCKFLGVMTITIVLFFQLNGMKFRHKLDELN